MTSWNNEVEMAASQLDAPPPTYGEEDSENLQDLRKKNAQPLQQKDRDMEISEMVETPQNTCGITAQSGFMELSRNDLLLFLGIMEGEVQAHEKIIQMLKSEHIRPAALEAHYGSAVPEKVLRALHRDSQLVHPKSFGEDIYKMPMAELDQLEGKHQETYRRMLEQLLLAEKCHRRTVCELENEKRKHADYMNKSDDFTNLLEQERESAMIRSE